VIERFLAIQSILNPPLEEENLGSRPTIFGRSFGPQAPPSRHEIAGRLNDEGCGRGMQ
jgi:hypothetical protein